MGWGANKMQVTANAAAQFAAIDACPSDDMLDLITAAGGNLRTFFNSGTWQGLDFSMYDMSSTEFLNATVCGCVFRSGDISPETISGCRIFEDNRFVESQTASTDGSSPSHAFLDAESIVELIRVYNPKTDEELIQRAYAFGAKQHEGQFRHSGEPYFTHPVAVACILTEQRVDDATIVAALLHDLIEDTAATKKQISEIFGDEIAGLVSGATKLTNLQLSSENKRLVENFRELFIAVAKDMRVILVKLADRLHNMRTIKTMRPEKQAQKATETLNVFAPLASQMGLQWMREELEDLSFKVLNPDARSSILRRFISQQKQHGDIVEKFISELREELGNAGLKTEVFGRAQKPYSIWRSMNEGHQGFSRLTDAYTFRVVTNIEDDCYRVQGVIHRKWNAVPGRFKDYISQPKSNGYRAVHTEVSGRDGLRVQIIIQSREMGEVADRGVFEAHSYREGERSKNSLAVDPKKWASAFSERLTDEISHEEFLDSVKIDSFADQVYCFTPKGEVIRLPRGSTPIDFAYAIHTRIGDACVGTKVDGLRTPLWTRLKNGQQVEIITAKGQTPQPTWLEICQSSRARAAIRRALRNADRDRFIRLGRELARVGFEAREKKSTDKAMRVAAKRLGLENSDQLLMKFGQAEVTVDEAFTALYPEVPLGVDDDIKVEDSIIGLGAGQIFSRASCCQPLPGERVVGIDSGGALEAHAIDCFELAKYEPKLERWVDIHWREGRHSLSYPISLSVDLIDSARALGRIFSLVDDFGSKVGETKLSLGQGEMRTLSLVIIVRDVEHLAAILDAIEAEDDVASVRRKRG